MAEFTLDTSGVVAHWHDNRLGVNVGPTYWSDLDDFTQGTLGKASEDAQANPTFMDALYLKHGRRALAFSDLAPEALAMILADCAARVSDQPRMGDKAHDGALFWADRQKGIAHAFPAVTISLGDDGKVYLRAVNDGAA